jgi:hypothetical protein
LISAMKSLPVIHGKLSSNHKSWRSTEFMLANNGRPYVQTICTTKTWQGQKSYPDSALANNFRMEGNWVERQRPPSNMESQAGARR